MKPAKETIREARFLLQHPDLLKAYAQSRKICHNHAPIYGNTTKIYNEIGPAIEYLAESQPSVFEKFANLVHETYDGLMDGTLDYTAALTMWQNIMSMFDLIQPVALFDQHAAAFISVFKSYGAIVMFFLRKKAKQKRDS